MRCAPKRSAMRPAGTPVSAATSGPTDMTIPTSSRIEPERRARDRTGPTTSVAIITVETSALMARLALSSGIAEHRQADQGRCGSRLGEHEEAAAAAQQPPAGPC